MALVLYHGYIGNKAMRIREVILLRGNFPAPVLIVELSIEGESGEQLSVDNVIVACLILHRIVTL